MSKKSHVCLNCRFAQWYRTDAGRLHPNGSGRCTWSAPEFKIPKAMYWLGAQRPSGGHIDRHDPEGYAGCPTWEANEVQS